MKRFLMVLVLASIFSMAAIAQSHERTEGKWTDISYVNVPVLKVLEGKDAYAVIYQKNKVGVGSTVIPKAWAHGTPDAPRKLKFRNVKTSIGAYMTVVKDNGEFKRVILSIPMNKMNTIWGVADTRGSMQGSDKESLEDLAL